jgi:penicillin-binding protein-related factor A (putative recombinase)
MGGKASQSSGSAYEELVTRFNKKLMKDYFVHKQQNIPVDYSKENNRKKIPRAKQLPDFVYIKNGSPSIAIECKQESKPSFSFSRLSPTQHQTLQNFGDRAGVSFVLIGFNMGLKNYLFEYKKYLKFQEIITSQGRKSFNREKDKELLRGYAKPVERLLSRTKYYLDLSLIRYF